MRNLTNAVRSFIRDEQGATTAEYGIITAVMVTIAAAALVLLKGHLNTLMNTAGTNMGNAAKQAG